MFKAVFALKDPTPPVTLASERDFDHPEVSTCDAPSLNRRPTQ
jgi:hypothetical protein